MQKEIKPKIKISDPPKTETYYLGIYRMELNSQWYSTMKGLCKSKEHILSDYEFSHPEYICKIIEIDLPLIDEEKPEDKSTGKNV